MLGCLFLDGLDVILVEFLELKVRHAQVCLAADLSLSLILQGNRGLELLSKLVMIMVRSATGLEL